MALMTWALGRSDTSEDVKFLINYFLSGKVGVFLSFDLPICRLTKMQIAGSQEIKGSHYLARKVLKLTVSRCSHQDINGTQPESWPKKLKTIQVSLSLPLEILTILSARLHSPGIQRTSLSQIFQLSVVTIQYCR